MIRADITKFIPTRTGSRAMLINVYFWNPMSVNGSDWDIFGVINDHAVSIAVSGTLMQIKNKFQFPGFYNVGGNWGKWEWEGKGKGKQRFRRLFCDIDDITTFASEGQP